MTIKGVSCTWKSEHIFFLYLNFIPGLMSVTFLFLKSFDPTPYFIRTERLIFFLSEYLQTSTLREFQL